MSVAASISHPPEKVLRDRQDYSPKHIRLIKTLYNGSMSKGSLGRRPDGWLDTMIHEGFGTGVVVKEKLLGFNVVRPIGVDQYGDFVAYGECSLWRGDDEYWDEIRAALIWAARDMGAKHVWGAFFNGNTVADRFFDVKLGFDRMPSDEVPECVNNILKVYEGIQFVRITVS